MMSKHNDSSYGDIYQFAWQNVSAFDFLFLFAIMLLTEMIKQGSKQRKGQEMPLLSFFYAVMVEVAYSPGLLPPLSFPSSHLQI